MAYEEQEAGEEKPAKKKDGEKMDESELQQLLHGMLTDAIQFTDDELSPERAKASDYYHGKKLGNEEDGRSQVVLTEVRDGILGVIPSFLRTIFGAKRVVEFQPTRPDNVEQAKQATDYVQHVFRDQNDGFLSSLAVIKDGLTKKIGIFKWGWDESSAHTNYSLRNVSEQDALALMDREDIEITRAEQNKDGSLNIEVVRTEKDGTPWVCEVPPEEFLFNRNARSIEEATLIAHRMEKTTSELIALGISEEDIEAYGGSSSKLQDSDENISRQPGQLAQSDPEAGESNDKHLYIESYVKVDFDGDGVNELRSVCTLGESYHPVKNEAIDERPFAIFCPDPEPHTLLGQSYADRLMDMQRTKTMVLRSTLDSLAAAIFPRTGYVNGMVNVQDILNTAIGAPIRMDAPGMIQPIITPFVGKEAFPVLEYLDEVVERRTGRNKGTLGLDGDALQSTGKEAAAAAITSSQEHAELLVQLFAEQTLKPLFKGLYGLLVKYQPRAKLVQLRGKFVPIDPAVWDADLQVKVNVALGTGDKDRQRALLQDIKSTQEAILQLYGPGNPLVTLHQYRNTIGELLELEGKLDTTTYFNEIDPNWQPPQQAPQPDPTQIIAQAQLEIERMRAMRELAIKEQELELKRQDTMLRDDRERDKAAADIVLRAEEIKARYGAQINQGLIDAEIERTRLTTQSLADHHAVMVKAATDQHATATQAAVDQHATETQAGVDRHATETQAQVDREANAQAASETTE
jgi:hypothetical protein